MRPAGFWPGTWKQFTSPCRIQHHGRLECGHAEEMFKFANAKNCWHLHPPATAMSGVMSRDCRPLYSLAGSCNCYELAELGRLRQRYDYLNTQCIKY